MPFFAFLLSKAKKLLLGLVFVLLVAMNVSFTPLQKSAPKTTTPSPPPPTSQPVTPTFTASSPLLTPGAPTATTKTRYRTLDRLKRPLMGVKVYTSQGLIGETDAGGEFYINPTFKPGKYWFYAQKNGYSFQPRLVTIAENGTPSFDISGETLALYSISGKITDLQKNPIADIPLWDNKAQISITDSTGFYIIAGLKVGLYQYNALSSEKIFTPQQLSVPIKNANVANQDIIAETGLAGSFITGRIMEGAKPIEGASVMDINTSRQTVSDKNGYYILGNLPAGQYKLIVFKENYTFDEYQRILNVPPSISKIDFAATSANPFNNILKVSIAAIGILLILAVAGFILIKRSRFAHQG